MALDKLHSKENAQLEARHAIRKNDLEESLSGGGMSFTEFVSLSESTSADCEREMDAQVGRQRKLKRQLIARLEPSIENTGETALELQHI